MTTSRPHARPTPPLSLLFSLSSYSLLPCYLVVCPTITITFPVRCPHVTITLPVSMPSLVPLVTLVYKWKLGREEGSSSSTPTIITTRACETTSVLQQQQTTTATGFDNDGDLGTQVIATKINISIPCICFYGHCE